MGRRTVPLVPDHLDALAATLPSGCGTCLVWELDPVRRGRLGAGDDVRTEEKHAWLAEVLREWGSCGRTLLVDDAPVGYVVYAPASAVPGAACLPTAPVSPDAVLMTTAYVHPAHRGGAGRLLVQGMARDLVRRAAEGGPRAVEAFGAVGGAGAGCRVPAEFLARTGFRTQRPHPTTPRLRMDLRSTVPWRDEVEAAIERLVGVVRPAAAPAPALPSALPTRTTMPRNDEDRDGRRRPGPHR